MHSMSLRGRPARRSFVSSWLGSCRLLFSTMFCSSIWCRSLAYSACLCEGVRRCFDCIFFCPILALDAPDCCCPVLFVALAAMLCTGGPRNLWHIGAGSAALSIIMLCELCRDLDILVYVRVCGRECRRLKYVLTGAMPSMSRVSCGGEGLACWQVGQGMSVDDALEGSLVIMWWGGQAAAVHIVCIWISGMGGGNVKLSATGLGDKWVHEGSHCHTFCWTK
jgi:hypothetical protein